MHIFFDSYILTNHEHHCCRAVVIPLSLPCVGVGGGGGASMLCPSCFIKMQLTRSVYDTELNQGLIKSAQIQI